MWLIIKWKLVRSEVVFTLLWQSVLNNLPANQRVFNEQSWVIIFSIYTNGLSAHARLRCCRPPTLTPPCPAPPPVSRPPTASAWWPTRRPPDTARWDGVTTCPPVSCVMWHRGQDHWILRQLLSKYSYPNFPNFWKLLFERREKCQMISSCYRLIQLSILGLWKYDHSRREQLWWWNYQDRKAIKCYLRNFSSQICSNVIIPFCSIFSRNGSIDH